MDAVLQSLAGIGRFGVFAAEVARRIPSRPFFLTETVRQLAITSIRCLLPVIAVVMPLGMVVSLQGLEIFRLFGAERLLSSLVNIAVLRELSPVLATTLVAAQGGASCAAELGAMRIKEELDATTVMAIDGVRYHVVPRVVALTLACPLLYVVGSAAGLSGGYLTAVVLRGEQGGIFLENLWTLTGTVDLWAGVLKTTSFGVAVGLIAAFHGYHVTGGAAGVGRAVNDTVVHSVLVFITMNYFFTSALFGVPG